jgi:hypothetical protein
MGGERHDADQKVAGDGRASEAVQAERLPRAGFSRHEMHSEPEIADFGGPGAFLRSAIPTMASIDPAPSRAHLAGRVEGSPHETARQTDAAHPRRGRRTVSIAQTVVTLAPARRRSRSCPSPARSVASVALPLDVLLDLSLQRRLGSVGPLPQPVHPATSTPTPCDRPCARHSRNEDFACPSGAVSGQEFHPHWKPRSASHLAPTWVATVPECAL